MAAVSVGILEAGPEQREGLILDLEYEEDPRAAVDSNLVAAREVNLLGVGAGELSVVEFQSTGEGRSFSRAEALGLVDMGLAGCEALMAAQVAALA